MDLHYLWLFYKVAEHLSFSKAAQELRLSQPTVSMQIKKFESQLGITLFDRFGRNIYLSREGKFVFEYAQRIFDIVKDLEEQIAIQRGEMIGNIHVGASNTPGVHIVPHLLGIFRQDYPDINAHLHIGTTSEILNMIIKNQVDFAIIGGDYDYKKTFQAKKLLDDSIIMIASPKNPLAQKDSVLAQDLIHQSFIAHEPDSNLYDATEDIIKNDLNIPLRISMILGNITAIHHAVAANLGISFVPLSSVKYYLEQGMVKKISVEDKVWNYPFYLVYYRDKKFNVASKLLIQTIEKKLHEFI